MKWFKFFPGDWLADSKVQAMSLEMQGIYMRILCYMWQDSEDATIPADPKFLRPLLGTSAQKTRKTCNFFFKSEFSPLKTFERNGTMFFQSERLLKEKLLAVKSQERKSLAGKKGANARWSKEEKDPWQPQCDRNATPMATKDTRHKNKDKNPPLTPPKVRTVPQKTKPQEGAFSENRNSANGRKWLRLVCESNCPNKVETVEMWARRWKAKGISEEEIVRAFQGHPGSTVIEIDQILKPKPNQAESAQELVRRSIREATP